MLEHFFALFCQDLLQEAQLQLLQAKSVNMSEVKNKMLKINTAPYK